MGPPSSGVSTPAQQNASALQQADTWLWVHCFHSGKGLAGTHTGGNTSAPRWANTWWVVRGAAISAE